LNIGGTATYIAVQRGSDRSSSLINGYQLVDDLCLFSSTQGDDIPFGYTIIDKNINRGAKGNKIFLGYHSRNALGICDLRYECGTLDRYPLKDHSGLELPVNELPMFTFPVRD
jgi:hypothetical protein